MRKLSWKRIVPLLAVCMLLSLCSGAFSSKAAEGYTHVRVQFTYGGKVYEPPYEVAVGKNIVIFADDVRENPDSDEYLAYRVPETGFESEEYKRFSDVEGFDREGFTLRWNFELEEEGDLYIWPSYTAIPPEPAPGAEREDVTYNYYFSWKNVDTQKSLPWFVTIPTVLSSSSANGVTDDFTRSSIDRSTVEAWLNSFTDRIHDLKYVVDKSELFANEDQYGVWRFVGFASEPVIGTDKKAGGRANTNIGYWRFEQLTYPMEYRFVSTDVNRPLPEAVTDVLPATANPVYLSAYTPVAPTTKTIETETGTWNFAGYDVNHISSVEGPQTFTGTWYFTPKRAEAGTQTDATATAEAGTQTDAAETANAGTQTDAAETANAGTQTDAAETANAGTQTDAAVTSEGGTQTDAAATSEGGTQTDAAETANAGTQTDAAVTAEAGTQTENAVAIKGEKKQKTENAKADTTKPVAPKTGDTHLPIREAVLCMFSLCAAAYGMRKYIF